VFEVGADHSPGGGGKAVQIDVVGQWGRAGVHTQDLLAAVLVGGLDRDAPVEAARPEQRRIENVGPG
jgi:hypothetical protein